MLAVELINKMIDKEIVQPSDNWGEERIAEVSARIESSVDRKEHARALVNLARVLNWAGKYEDAGQLARKAMTYKDVAPEAYIFAIKILATQYQVQGDIDQAVEYYRKALHAAPENTLIHVQFGFMFLNEPLRNIEVGAAHVLFATVFDTEDDQAYTTFGLAMAERRRYSLAYSMLSEAVRINPQNERAASALARLSELVDPELRHPDPPKIAMDKYPSGVPSKIVQMRKSFTTGRYIADGIWTEWYENGELKRFVDYANGVAHGVEINWSPDGQVVSRIEYRKGKK